MNFAVTAQGPRQRPLQLDFEGPSGDFLTTHGESGESLRAYFTAADAYRLALDLLDAVAEVDRHLAPGIRAAREASLR